LHDNLSYYTIDIKKISIPRPYLRDYKKIIYIIESIIHIIIQNLSYSLNVCDVDKLPLKMVMFILLLSVNNEHQIMITSFLQNATRCLVDI
jgi:hypothetical protein